MLRKGMERSCKRCGDEWKEGRNLGDGQSMRAVSSGNRFGGASSE
jgi:hypothetical protein